MTNIYFESRFLRGRPTVIFSSSLGANCSMWQPQIEKLSGEWNTIALDMRGHGRSPMSENCLTIDALADDVISVADSLGVEKFSFCGLSIGGAVGQSLGARYGDRLHSLILASTGLTILSPQALQERAERVLSEGMEWAAALSTPRWFTDSFRQSRPEIVASTFAHMKSMKPQGYADACGALAKFDGNLYIDNIVAPTCVIMGAADAATPAEGGRALAEKIKGASYHLIPDASHLCNLEKPEAFTELLRSHLVAGSN